MTAPGDHMSQCITKKGASSGYVCNTSVLCDRVKFANLHCGQRFIWVWVNEYIPGQ